MDRQRALVIGIGALVLIGGGAVALLRPSRMPVAAPPETVPVVEPKPPAMRSWLDGHPLAEGEAQPAAVAVVVDNAPEARPQSGIADAPLVFEVPVEGGRTRFLAVFPLDADVREVGPVRSARPYLAVLAGTLHAPLVHVGGSDEALRSLRRQPHINQYYDPPFRRVNFRRAPFNVYTSLAPLTEFVRQQSWNAWALDRSTLPHEFLWPFDEGMDTDAVLVMTPGDHVRLPFGGTSGEVVEWSYDAASEQYVRSLHGRPQRDANGKAITAENVVVLRVDTEVLDAVGRLKIARLASSEDVTVRSVPFADPAAVYRGGQRVSGTWTWQIGRASCRERV